MVMAAWLYATVRYDKPAQLQLQLTNNQRQQSFSNLSTKLIQYTCPIKINLLHHISHKTTINSNNNDNDNNQQCKGKLIWCSLIIGLVPCLTTHRASCSTPLEKMYHSNSNTRICRRKGYTLKCGMCNVTLGRTVLSCLKLLNTQSHKFKGRILLSQNKSSWTLLQLDSFIQLYVRLYYYCYC